MAEVKLREDVKLFASWMSEAMDSKRIERDQRNDPQYMQPEYRLQSALDCVKDKVDQLVYDAFWRPEDYERVRKTAVHLANFCMIICRKVEAGHKVDLK